jgi:hypothetical protein
MHFETPIGRATTKEDIDNIASGKIIYYLYGQITYADIFRNAHETTFCMYLKRDMTEFEHCDTYNDANSMPSGYKPHRIN